MTKRRSECRVQTPMRQSSQTEQVKADLSDLARKAAQAHTQVLDAVARFSRQTEICARLAQDDDAELRVVAERLLVAYREHVDLARSHLALIQRLLKTEQRRIVFAEPGCGLWWFGGLETALEMALPEA